MEPQSLSFAYSYGCRNAGDFAINEGSLSLIERTAPNADVSTISRFDADSAEFATMAEKLESLDTDVELFGGPISYDPSSQSRPAQLASLVQNGLRYGFDITAPFEDSEYHSQLFKQITDSDGLLFNGGNAIHYSPNHQSIAYLLAVLYPIQVARRHDIPYAIFPQTIFGLEGISKQLVVPLLNDAEFVMTRDTETFRYLSEFGLSTQLINAVDTAFLNGTPLASANVNDRKKIAVVPRFSTLGDTGELDDTASDMERTFKTYLSSLVEAGHEVTLTIQTEIDEQWIAQNRTELESIGVECYSSFEPQELRDHYAEMDLLVTMRLHAAIFALSMGTPTVGVYRPEWGPKMEGTFETLDIEKYAIPWGDTTADTLLSLTDDALANGETLSEHIASSVRLRNQQMISDLKSAFRNADGFDNIGSHSHTATDSSSDDHPESYAPSVR